MISFWERDTSLADVDFLLIGAGITGMNAAIALKSRHPLARVLVIDRHPWGGGASYRNAGFACLGSPTELEADLARFGEDVTLDLVEMRWKGLNRLLQKLEGADIDLAWCGGMEVFPAGDDEAYQRAMQIIPFLNKAFHQITGEPQNFYEAKESPAGIQELKGVIRIAREGRLHPGKMMQALSALAGGLGVSLMRGLEVSHLDPTDKGIRVTLGGRTSILAGSVGIATNGFTADWYPGLPVFPARNQVFLSHPLDKLEWDTCMHYHQGYVYARRVDDRLLIGGARHLALQTETMSEEGITQPIRTYLTAFARRHFGLDLSAGFAWEWSGTLGVGDAKHPYIEDLGDRVHAAVRLGGMGVAIGTLVGESLAHRMAP